MKKPPREFSLFRGPDGRLRRAFRVPAPFLVLMLLALAWQCSHLT